MAALEKTPIQCVEVTLRSEYSCEAIKNIKAKYPDMIVGAGTVMNLADYAKARACGADYIVSPGLDTELVMKCMEDGIPVVPQLLNYTQVHFRACSFCQPAALH